MRPARLSKVLDCEFKSAGKGHHTPVLFRGSPGEGKPQFVAQVAERHNITVVGICLPRIKPGDLRGIPFRAGNRAEWAVPAPLPAS